MAESSLQYLTAAYQSVDTAMDRWLKYADAATTNYSAARKNHERILKAAKEAIEAQQKQQETAWIVMQILLSTVAPWAGRLLTPVANQVGGMIKDKLTLDWAKDALSGPAAQAAGATIKEKATGAVGGVWDLLKGSALEGVKTHSGSTSDSFAPVSPEAVDFGARLKEGIRGRTIPLKDEINKFTLRAHQVSIAAAKAIHEGFEYRCPLVTDKPQELSTDDKAFQRTAELEMWVDWGLTVDDKWWRGQGRKDLGKLGPIVIDTDPATIGRRVAMRPIMDQLLSLGVPGYAISSEVKMNGPKGPIFDMLKFINWAHTRRYPRCYPTLLQLKHDQNMCPLPQTATSSGF